MSASEVILTSLADSQNNWYASEVRIITYFKIIPKTPTNI
jgi:hypothetical protein